MTLEEFNKHLDFVFRKRAHKPDPSTVVDFELLHKHNISYTIENDIVLFSSDGIKRAREVGAIKPNSHARIS